MHRQQGITLVEVLITVLITAFGIVGLVSLQLSALQANQLAAQKAVGGWLVQDLVERMRANPSGATTYTGSADCADPVRSCLNQSCTPAELAAWDIEDVMCADRGDGNTLSARTLTVDLCATAAIACATNASHRITLNWSTTQANSSVGSTAAVSGSLRYEVTP
ncbi:hypothetical protein GCM10023116_10960 [Kistimonas scapharcae]|uniref:Type IV pilin Tt1218-like domain-containing protein n=1 Tax=Kistimonas scapharcae TaxID=1036133 RepID=A0ABP8UY15_9GAMM